MDTNTTERRRKEHCMHCGGTELKWMEANSEGKMVVKKVCLICGEEFLARRSTDLHKFNAFAKEFNS